MNKLLLVCKETNLKLTKVAEVIHHQTTHLISHENRTAHMQKKQINICLTQDQLTNWNNQVNQRSVTIIRQRII